MAESVTGKRLHIIKKKVCIGCGKQFDTSREHAKTCGVNCREALYRKRKKLELQSDRVAWDMQDLLEALSDPVVQAKAYKLIQRCKNTVKDVVIEADQTPYARQLALFEIAGG